jgi:hypothetical protein
MPDYLDFEYNVYSDGLRGWTWRVYNKPGTTPKVIKRGTAASSNKAIAAAKAAIVKIDMARAVGQGGGDS